MKQNSNHLLRSLFLFIAIAIGVMIWKQNFYSVHKKPLSVVTGEQLQHQKQSKNATTIPDLPATPQVGRCIPVEPSPLKKPSAEELREFPGAIVVEANDIEGPGPNQKTRLRILNTHFKYPNVRTEEIIDTKNNSVVMRQEMVADHFLVTLPQGEDPQTFFNSMGDQATSMVRVTDREGLYRVNLTQKASLHTLPTAIAAAAQITAGTAEPDGIVHACLTPNDPMFKRQWNRYTPSACVNAQDAWKVRTDASSIIVAIIDTGVRYTHEDLADNIWNNPEPTAGDVHGWNAAAQPASGNVLDTVGHGTHCAGTIGAVGNNGIGICGIAWKVQLMPCVFLNAEGSGVQSDEIFCIDYAVAYGAKILNCSFGSYLPSQAELDAFYQARAAGVIVVCAAGNDGLENGGRISDRSSPLYGQNVALYPASYNLDNIVSVAATDYFDELTSFSNFGKTSVHLGAPGVAIFSTYGGPTYNPGFTITGVDDSAYAYMDGTSAAAPFVSGALALLMAQFPDEPFNSIIARLLTATDKIPSLEEKTISGGRLNILNALTAPFTPLPPSHLIPPKAPNPPTIAGSNTPTPPTPPTPPTQ